MQVIKYEAEGGILTVGFKVNDFVVYSQVKDDKNKSKKMLLQDAYIKCRESIQYEMGLSKNSFTTDKSGELFVPDKPIPYKLKVDFDTFGYEVLDQYGEALETEGVLFSIEGTDKARIEGGKIVEDEVEEDTSYTIVARYNNLTCKEDRMIYKKEDDKYDKLERYLLSKIDEAYDFSNEIRDEILHEVSEETNRIESKTNSSLLKSNILEEGLLDIQKYLIDKEYNELLEKGGIDIDL